MNHVALFLIGFCFYFISNNSNSATVYIPMPQGATLANGTDVHFKYPASSTDYEANYRSSKDYQTASGKYIPTTYEHKVKPNIPKLGPALAKALRAAPWVGTALYVKDIVCELTDICENPDDPTKPYLKNDPDKPTAENPAQTPFLYYSLNNSAGFAKSPTPQPVCTLSGYPSGFIPVDGSVQFSQTNPANGTSSSNGFCVRRNQSGSLAAIDPINQYTGCAPNYYKDGLVCKKNISGVPTYIPVTGQDWVTAEPKLSNPRVLPPMAQAGIPVPVDVPQFQPKETVVEKRTTTERDATGTATGTREETTRAKFEPLPNPNPTSLNSPVKVTETTTTVVTNITNNTTNTTTTTYEAAPDEPPPEKEPEDTDLEFDEVADSDLKQHELGDDFNHNSFGEGTCLPDPVISYSKGSLTIPFHVACEFATLMRFVVLIISTLIAAYIIIGGKHGSD